MNEARFMRRAIELAADHRTHPNPRVGAVIVDDRGEILGEGGHIRAGTDHAEVVALHAAGGRAPGATMFVTLEPCSHHGLTPPCTDAIIDSGVSRVVVGVVDPDDRVTGSGIEQLEQAGIAVEVGLLAEESEGVDPGYFHQRRSGMPLVVLKTAMTLDGSIAAQDGTSQWITSEEARADAHRLRAKADAVVVGAGTLRTDDPLLTVRHGDTSHQPVPVIVAGLGDLPQESKVWSRSPLVISAIEREIPSGELILVEGEDARPDPVESARALASRGLYDLLLEGGAGLAGAWWRAGVVTSGVFYVGAKIGGGAGAGPLAGAFSTLTDADSVNIRDMRSVGGDLRIEFDR